VPHHDLFNCRKAQEKSRGISLSLENKLHSNLIMINLASEMATDMKQVQFDLLLSAIARVA
jgi:hypothetical protein